MLQPAVYTENRRTPIVNQTGKRKARILVVDDDPGLLRLLTIRLRAENYDVEAVESGAQALAAASRFRPDLVITDLRMDQMDGIGLLKELQKVDSQLTLAAENRRLQSAMSREDRDKLAAVNKRLQTETDENARLRKELEEAQKKLDAVANIERSLNEQRKP